MELGRSALRPAGRSSKARHLRAAAHTPRHSGPQQDRLRTDGLSPSQGIVVRSGREHAPATQPAVQSAEPVSNHRIHISRGCNVACRRPVFRARPPASGPRTGASILARAPAASRRRAGTVLPRSSRTPTCRTHDAQPALPHTSSSNSPGSTPDGSAPFPPATRRGRRRTRAFGALPTEPQNKPASRSGVKGGLPSRPTHPHPSHGPSEHAGSLRAEVSERAQLS